MVREVVAFAATLPAEVEHALRSLQLLNGFSGYTCQPLAGGVSSDIWLVETGARRFCVKRALARLRVAREWTAPITRNATEVAWFRCVARIAPECVPKVLGHDPSAGIFAMEYLPPERYALWKALLRDGHAKLSDASAVGRALGRIHAATAGDSDVARTFATDAEFHALRLEPYLEASAALHPDRAAQLRGLVSACRANRRVLVHGDISPKNILIGPEGPVFLDAETAWYGDPAFDLAFCLNHLLLKCLWNPAASVALMACFDALRDAYLASVDWEPVTELDSRVSALLPGLLLARVDGKSPVEYLLPDQQHTVRAFAREVLLNPAHSLAQLGTAWRAWLQMPGGVA